MVFFKCKFRLKNRLAYALKTGSKEYYYCSVCGNYFEDVNGSVVIGNSQDLTAWLNDINGGQIEKDPNAHDFTYVKEVPATTESERTKEHWVCSVCGDIYIENDHGELVLANANELKIQKLN